MSHKTHNLYEIFRHEQERMNTSPKYKDIGFKVTYDEDKDLLRYTNVDGAITVTFDTQNNVKEPTAVYYKFNEALHPVGQMYRQTYDEIFDEWYDKYVPEPDCEYGIKSM